MKTRIEANMERSGRGEQEGPVYYGMNSTARRSSQDCGGAGAKKDINVINDDLADEIEAIRLAADFSSRRMLNDQKKQSTTGSASSSRLRIRALLDKQTNRALFRAHHFLPREISLSCFNTLHHAQFHILCM